MTYRAINTDEIYDRIKNSVSPSLRGDQRFVGACKKCGARRKLEGKIMRAFSPARPGKGSGDDAAITTASCLASSKVRRQANISAGHDAPTRRVPTATANVAAKTTARGSSRSRATITKDTKEAMANKLTWSDGHHQGSSTVIYKATDPSPGFGSGRFRIDSAHGQYSILRGEDGSRLIYEQWRDLRGGATAIQATMIGRYRTLGRAKDAADAHNNLKKAKLNANINDATPDSPTPKSAQRIEAELAAGGIRLPKISKRR